MTSLSCLLVTVDFPPSATGGIQRYYYDLCRESNGRISVVAPRCAGCDEFDKGQPFAVKRVRVPTGGAPLSRALLAALMAFHTGRILLFGRHKKLVVGHWFLLPALIWISGLRGLQTAVVMHGGELSRFRSGSSLRRVLVGIINRCDEVIVNSSYTAGQFADLGVTKSRVNILTPAVDSERYRPGPYHTPDALLGEPEVDGATLLTVATLVERKGHASVISVLPRILAKHPFTRYVIIGDGPCRASLTALAEQLGVARTVHFLGRATDDEVVAWLHACDIFVMPSKKLEGKSGEEGFGIVYLEANACGKPVVGGDSGGVRDAVIDGVTGLLVDPQDSDALFEALDQLISRKDLRDSLGRKGRQRVVKDFQWRDRVEALLQGAPHHE
jgi:phosphatidylinositol alpha-1,6-mannosyltransferase